MTEEIRCDVCGKTFNGELGTHSSMVALNKGQFCDAQIWTRVSTPTTTADPGTSCLNGYFRTLTWSGKGGKMVKRSVKWTVKGGEPEYRVYSIAKVPIKCI
jgi:hypothetical protein